MISATVARKSLLMMAVLLLSGLLVDCRSRSAATVSLAQLAAKQDAYAGRLVDTIGTVRSFLDASSRYYVIEDAHQNRVELLPGRLVSRYVGRRVEVTGKFEFDERSGRFIAIEEIVPLTPGSAG